ncbi:hypothetical protein BLD48_05755 [Exiguobacterium sp. KRL4]|uniref:hypothetical protein n=1 Tax=Exiguobacterium sp. KRL4 TaxID=1914536 RepID=UPI0008F8955F|nr:hypothetical protein [Exiguobacterium sp. KRL4]OIN67395.1 hypothetical protein BLD48_05755 [Exiguobacterium sp. KRL4]
MANTNEELAALSQLLKPLLPANAKIALQNFPEKPVKQTLVLRSLPDEVTPIASGMTRTIRSYQIFYVDDRIDTAQAVGDALKVYLAQTISIPVNAQTLAFMRISSITGGKPFKTEGSAPLDGVFLTIQSTSHTARSTEVYETMQHASLEIN